MTYALYVDLANGKPALTEEQFNAVNARHAGNADKRASRRSKSAADRNVRASFVIPEKNQAQLNQYFEDRRAQEMAVFIRKQG